MESVGWLIRLVSRGVCGPSIVLSPCSAMAVVALRFALERHARRLGQAATDTPIIVPENGGNGTSGPIDENENENDHLIKDGHTDAVDRKSVV